MSGWLFAVQVILLAIIIQELVIGFGWARICRLIYGISKTNMKICEELFLFLKDDISEFDVAAESTMIGIMEAEVEIRKMSERIAIFEPYARKRWVSTFSLMKISRKLKEINNIELPVP